MPPSPDNHRPDDHRPDDGRPDSPVDEIFVAAGGIERAGPTPEHTGVGSHSVYPDEPGSVLDFGDDRHGPVAWGRPELPPSSGHMFARRPAQHGPGPDQYGYYPDDYYLGTDWPRAVMKFLLVCSVIIGGYLGGLALYDRYAPSDGDDEVLVQPTPTPAALVTVYACAGDIIPVTEMTPPGPILIAGRTADSRWIAFRNPAAPPLQLWVLAADVPGIEPAQVGIVSCADSPEEFPTPLGGSRGAADADESQAG